MSDIPVLWTGLSVGAVTPLVVLRTQAEAISQQTGGILSGRVVSTTVESRAIHNLVVFAPAINQSIDAVKVEHNALQPYPAIVIPFTTGNPQLDNAILEASPEEQARYEREMSEFRLAQREWTARYQKAIGQLTGTVQLLGTLSGLGPSPKPPEPPRKRHKLGSPVPGYSEFVETLGRALQSPALIGALNSLISKTNEGPISLSDDDVLQRDASSAEAAPDDSREFDDTTTVGRGNSITTPAPPTEDPER